MDLGAWRKATTGGTKAAKAAKATAAATAAAARPDGKGTTPSPVLAASTVKTHGKGISRVYRPSGRRTADGFNRYIQELNASMSFNVKEKIEEEVEA